jgi:hypothetical protein
VVSKVEVNVALDEKLFQMPKTGPTGPTGARGAAAAPTAR